MSRPDLQDRLSQDEAAEIGRRFVALMRQMDNYTLTPEAGKRRLVELYDDAREWAGECPASTPGSRPHQSLRRVA